MKTHPLFIFSTLFTFLFFSAVAQTPVEKSILISKENLRQILTDNNQKQNIDMVFDGFDAIPNNNNNTLNGVSILKQNITEINTPKKKAFVEVTNNIVNFRSFLELNSVKYIYADGLKIRTSNIISQEEASKISSTIIDVPPVVFKVEYNDTTKIGCYQFRLYYFKTKLFVSMDNYSTNLLNGYIDLFQTRIEETKAILNKFE